MKSVKAIALLGVAVASFGCTPDWAQQNETALIMEIAEIAGVRGGAQGTGEEAVILFSDVSAWINDDAVVTVNLYRKNPTVTSTSPLEHVRLESYQVRYLRSDGRNVEGVDVPHRITGSLSALRIHTPTDTGEQEVEAVINIVRHTAKREPPLINLIDSDLTPVTRGPFLTGEGIIATSAEITIYARQVTTGEPLSATGRFQVVFSDFVDLAQ
jgi:hypothetical protein